MNAINELQEFHAKQGLALPTYTTISTLGPDHSPQFTVRVDSGRHSALGSGLSKVAARKQAAEKLLTLLICPLSAADPNSIPDMVGFEISPELYNHYAEFGPMKITITFQKAPNEEQQEMSRALISKARKLHLNSSFVIDELASIQSNK